MLLLVRDKYVKNRMYIIKITIKYFFQIMYDTQNTKTIWNNVKMEFIIFLLKYSIRADNF